MFLTAVPELGMLFQFLTAQSGSLKTLSNFLSFLNTFNMTREFVTGMRKCANMSLSFVPAVSVSVGVWTLVAISLERYFAICRPLKSRRWQTRFHACKMIVVVWIASCIMNSPILAVSTLQAMKYTGTFPANT